MDLNRASRYLELFFCLLFVVMFYVRLRAIRRDSTGEPLADGLRTAMRPIRFGAIGLLLLAVVLWTEARWQLYAHALTIPGILSLGIADAVVRVGGPLPAQKKT